MGFTLNLPLFNTSFSMTGTFNADGTPDEGEHNVKLNLYKGTALRDIEPELKAAKTNEPAEKLRITTVKDSESGEINGKLTPRGVIEIYGDGLKIAGNSDSCGIWFVAADGQERRAGKFVANGNKPSLLLAMIPDLSPGKYRVKVVTQFTGGRLRKNPKWTVFKKYLTVNDNE
jgi:hypothetical protein